MQRPERQGSKFEINGTQIHKRTIAESVTKSVRTQKVLLAFSGDGDGVCFRKPNPKPPYAKAKTKS